MKSASWKAVLLVAVLCGPAWAADVAVAKITAPAVASPGDLVILSAEGSVANDYEWRLIGSTKTFLEVDGGVRVVFASGTPGLYTFALAVAHQDTVSLAVHTVRVGQPPPPDPDPDPEPDPNPQPAGPRDLLIFRESADDTPTQARLWTALRTGSAGEYLKSKDHALSILDDDSEGADGRTAAVIEAWKPKFSTITLPALFIVDRKSKLILHAATLPGTATADDVLATLKAKGG